MICIGDIIDMVYYKQEWLTSIAAVVAHEPARS